MHQMTKERRWFQAKSYISEHGLSGQDVDAVHEALRSAGLIIARKRLEALLGSMR